VSGIVVALSCSLIIIAAAYAAALVLISPPSPGKELTYDDITRYAVCQAARTPGPFQVPLPPSGPSSQTYCSQANRRIMTADFLDEDSRIVGTLANTDGAHGVPFWSAYPKSDATTNDLIRTMVAGNTKVVVDPQTGKQLIHFLAQFVLPLVLLANLFALLFYFVQRSGSGVADFVRFGRVGNKRIAGAGSPGMTTFADVAAADDAVAELAEIRDYLKAPTAFADIGAMPPKGVLLVGPPGCGKTLLARAVAGEAQASFFAMSGSEFVESLVGVGAARVRDLFTQARQAAPAILFIDELDAVGRQRGAGVGQGHDEREQTLNELLVQMDGFSATEGLVVLAASNRPDILDPALLRAGRFDRHVTVDRPDVDGRLAILRLHGEGRRLADPGADLPRVAKATPGFTGADLANLLNEAALLAVREEANVVARRHLDEAAERVVGGPRRRSHVLSPEEKRAVSYHEAGHALVAAGLGKVKAIQKVSIIARGRGIGHLALLAEEQAIVRRSGLEAGIAIAMAGVAVEEVVFGEASTGCEQDVERATHAARDLAGRYGLSARIGRVRVLAQDREIFLGRDYLGTRDVSQPTLEELDSEVRRIVDEQFEVARRIIVANRAVLDDLAAELAERETLMGAELEDALRAVVPPPPSAAVSA
jgi:cell division protease FtsH